MFPNGGRRSAHSATALRLFRRTHRGIQRWRIGCPDAIVCLRRSGHLACARIHIQMLMKASQLIVPPRKYPGAAITAGAIRRPHRRLVQTRLGGHVGSPRARSDPRADGSRNDVYARADPGPGVARGIAFGALVESPATSLHAHDPSITGLGNANGRTALL